MQDKNKSADQRFTPEAMAKSVIELKVNLGNGELVVTYNFSQEQIYFDGDGAEHFESQITPDVRIVMDMLLGAIARDLAELAGIPEIPDTETEG